MNTSLMFLAVVFMALCGFAIVIGLMVMVFRAATRTSGRPPGDASSNSTPSSFTDDRLTNPANPLYHLHHPTSASDDPNRHHSSSFGASTSAFDSGSSSSDSGSSSSSSSDSGGCSGSSDSGGSGCG
jgi:uncharacterized membrane protein YgcG